MYRAFSPPLMKDNDAYSTILPMAYITFVHYMRLLCYTSNHPIPVAWDRSNHSNTRLMHRTVISPYLAYTSPIPRNWHRQPQSLRSAYITVRYSLGMQRLTQLADGEASLVIPRTNLRRPSAAPPTVRNSTVVGSKMMGSRRGSRFSGTT